MTGRTLQRINEMKTIQNHQNKPDCLMLHRTVSKHSYTAENSKCFNSQFSLIIMQFHKTLLPLSNTQSATS